MAEETQAIEISGRFYERLVKDGFINDKKLSFDGESVAVLGWKEDDDRYYDAVLIEGNPKAAEWLKKKKETL